MTDNTAPNGRGGVWDVFKHHSTDHARLVETHSWSDRSQDIRRILFALSFLMFLAAPAAAEHCTPITSVPVTLSEPGAYCAVGHLSFPASSGAAVTIAADFVTLDLQGYTIEGTAGSNTTATGIASGTGRRGLQVRNGTLSGFLYAVRAEPPNDGASVRHVLFLDNWYIGPSLEGAGVEISDSRVLRTGGSTLSGFTRPIGMIARGSGARVTRNTVHAMTMQPGCNTAACEVLALSIDAAPGGLVEQNTFSLVADTPQSYAIWINGLATRLTLKGNVFTGWGWGIVCSHGISAYAGNSFMGVTTPTSMHNDGVCIDAGGNQ